MLIVAIMLALAGLVLFITARTVKRSGTQSLDQYRRKFDAGQSELDRQYDEEDAQMEQMLFQSLNATSSVLKYIGLGLLAGAVFVALISYIGG